MASQLRNAAVLALAVAVSACTVHQTTPPPPTGPSDISTLFSVSTGQVVMNVPVTFDASASTPSGGATAISSFTWNFGDSTSGNGRVVAHTFTAAGEFNVTLTTVDNLSRPSTFSRLIAVGVSKPPAGDWTWSPSAVVVGATINFNAGAIQPDSGRTIVQRLWDFGDGTTESDRSPTTTHVFRQANTFKVTLTAIDDAGQQLIVSHDIVVGTGNPVPSFTVSPATPAVGQNVSFDASPTQVFGAVITSYQWTFGDGNSSTNGPQTSNTYTAASTYTVSLTVTDSLGRRGTFSSPVTVK